MLEFYLENTVHTPRIVINYRIALCKWTVKKRAKCWPSPSSYMMSWRLIMNHWENRTVIAGEPHLLMVVLKAQITSHLLAW